MTWGSIKCPKCSAANPGTAKACGACGQSFQAAAKGGPEGAVPFPAASAPQQPSSSAQGVFGPLRPAQAAPPAAGPASPVDANAVFGRVGGSPGAGAPPAAQPAAAPGPQPAWGAAAGPSLQAAPPRPPQPMAAPPAKLNVTAIALGGVALVALAVAAFALIGNGRTPAATAVATGSAGTPTPYSGGACRGAIGTGSADPNLAECVKAATVLLEIGIYESDEDEVRRRGKIATGTGFFIDDHGLIATARHVVSGELAKLTTPRLKVRVSVLLLDGTRVDTVRCLADDDNTDVSILRIERSTPKYLRLSEEDRAAEMTPVLVVGHPMDKERWSFTRGDISSRTTIEDRDFYGITARVEPGNSGGPVMFTSTLEVIGVADAKVRGTGLNYAVPVRPLRKLVQGHRDDDGRSCGPGRRTGF